MTRDEWNSVLETEPITPNQRGRIMEECWRLGLHTRAERLAVLAGLLGLDGLDSTSDLTMGQAGQLVNVLQRTSKRTELAAAAAAVEEPAGGDDGEHQAAESAAERISAAEVLTRIMLRVYLASRETENAGGAARIGRAKLRAPAREESFNTPAVKGVP